MTDEEPTVEEPEQTVSHATARRSRPTDEDGDEAATEETSPFPYAENFDEWVADETTAPGGRQRPRDAGES